MLWKRFVTTLVFQSHQNIYVFMAHEVKDPNKDPEAGAPIVRPMSSYAAKVSGAHNIVMMRHGESEWGKLNLFCGWYDSSLSERGKNQAIKAGKTLKEAGYKFDIAFTSVLSRARHTLDYMLKELGQENIPVIKSWRLNERHYGSLTGMNRLVSVEKYGKEQVAVWRRSFDVLPPPITPEHPYYEAIINSPIYDEGPPKNEFPTTESLKLTIARALPFWNSVIVPEIKKGKTILIATHGTSLRALVQHLDEVSNEAITKLNLPTGIPFQYALDENLKPVPNGSLQFMADPEVVKKAMEEVANQIKKKT